MDHVLSTHLFVSHRLTVALLERVWLAGIPAVEIFCARQHLDYRDPAQIRELRHWFRDSELKLHSLHAPMYRDDIWGVSGPQSVITITDPVQGKRIAAVDEIKRALEIAEAVPFRYLIQHFGVGEEEYDDRKLDAAMSSLEELNLFARQRGVEILLENIPNQLSSSERLSVFLAQTHLDLNFCFDVGHAHIMEGIERAFEVMKPRIRSTHIHDNDGVVPILPGTVPAPSGAEGVGRIPAAARPGAGDFRKAGKHLDGRAKNYHPGCREPRGRDGGDCRLVV